MSEENVHSQTANTTSQNNIGQQTLEEIKTRSERIIKQKCKDDFKLNNLQKDHEDFQKLIEENTQQISEAEKNNRYLENAFAQLVITRGSVKFDADMISKSVSEYKELFNDMKKSIRNISNGYSQNEELLKNLRKQVQNPIMRNLIKEKIKDLKNKKKTLEEFRKQTVELQNNLLKNFDNRNNKLSNLDNEEQELTIELKILENKDAELKKQLEERKKRRDDLQNEVDMKKNKLDELIKELQAEKLSNDKKIEALEQTFNEQKEKISSLEKNLQEVTTERKAQIFTKEVAEKEVTKLEKYLTEIQIKEENQEEQKFMYNKMIEDLRINSSKFINESEKQLQNQNETLNSINTSNDQIQNNIINDKKILDDLKHQEDIEEEEMNSLQNEIKELLKNDHESEINHKGIIDEINIEIKAEKQNLLGKKEELLAQKDNIIKMISDLQLKKINCINESTQIEIKQNASKNAIEEEIAKSRKILMILEEDCEKMKNSYDIQYEEISQKFKEEKNEILATINQYKERMEIAERKEDETFKHEKSKYLEEQTKMELQINEYNATINNLQGKLIKIVAQINSENNSNMEKNIPLKSQNKLKQNGVDTKQPKIKNKKEEVETADKVFEWTTDEEEYKQSQKLKITQTQITKNEKSSSKVQKNVEMSQKKESSKQSLKKLIINKISSTDSEFEWIQPLSKMASRKSK